MYEYNALIENVIDGDTVDALVDMGFGLTMMVRFRLLAENHEYFDTPESWRPTTEAEREHGEQAKARATELLLGKTFKIKSIKKGKYRYVCNIVLEDGSDYGDKMINEGFQKRDSY